MVFRMQSQLISEGQVDVLRKLGLPEVKENNPWLVLHVKGDGIRAPESWNAKVYGNSTGSMKVVTTDMATLVALLDGSQPALQRENEYAFGINKVPSRIISIDDSGWGYPIGGTLVGLSDSFDNSIHFGEVAVSYYQSPCFEGKAYLHEAADVVVKLLGKLNTGNADVFNSRTVGNRVLFKVCTGYVNAGIVKELKERGFKVETCAIGEPLQSALEKEHRKYIKRLTNADIYYDPKELDPSNISRAYSNVMRWIKKNNAWDIAKTGWKSMKKLQRG